MFDGWAGPIEFAAVVEAAQQGYRLNPDPRANLDYEVQNVDRGGGERTRYSGGLEFSVPLTTTLTATLAGRYDRYGDYEAFNDDANLLDIGTQKESTWSAGLQWRPIDSLLLRGSYATSFRAPDMHYLLSQPSSAQVRTLDQYRCIASGAYQTNNCTGDNTAVTYPFAINRRGTPDLESELGDSWTVGFVWDAFENFSFTADYWRIHLDEEIRDIDETTILRDEAGCRTGLTITPGQAWSNLAAPTTAPRSWRACNAMAAARSPRSSAARSTWPSAMSAASTCRRATSSRPVSAISRWGSTTPTCARCASRLTAPTPTPSAATATSAASCAAA